MRCAALLCGDGGAELADALQSWLPVEDAGATVAKTCKLPHRRAPGPHGATLRLQVFHEVGGVVQTLSHGRCRPWTMLTQPPDYSCAHVVAAPCLSAAIATVGSAIAAPTVPGKPGAVPNAGPHNAIKPVCEGVTPMPCGSVAGVRGKKK